MLFFLTHPFWDFPSILAPFRVDFQKMTLNSININTLSLWTECYNKQIRHYMELNWFQWVTLYTPNTSTLRNQLCRFCCAPFCWDSTSHQPPQQGTLIWKNIILEKLPWHTGNSVRICSNVHMNAKHWPVLFEADDEVTSSSLITSLWALAVRSNELNTPDGPRNRVTFASLVKYRVQVETCQQSVHLTLQTQLH